MNRILKDLRKKNKYTLEDMAKLIGLKTPSAYYKKESGKIPFTIEEGIILANFYNVSLEELFCDETSCHVGTK